VHIKHSLSKHIQQMMLLSGCNTLGRVTQVNVETLTAVSKLQLMF